MPYDGEFAQHRSIKRLVESGKVTTLLGSFEVRQSTQHEAALQQVIRPEIRPSDWNPSKLIAVDGSHVEVTVKNGFPGAEASYLTVSSVIIDIAKSRELDMKRPVDPVQFREIETPQSIDCALPGCNVVNTGCGSAAESLRASVFEVFGKHSAMDGGETLLQTYEALLAHKPPTDIEKEANCPYGEDCGRSPQKYQRGIGEYNCPCPHKKTLFSTDALRSHEEMNDSGSSGAMFGEIMQVLERVWLVHIVRLMEQQNWLYLLRDIAIIMDGPLAVFGHPARLSAAIATELKRINVKVRQATDGCDMLIIGVEKSGTFVEHFDLIDTDETGHMGKYPLQTAALLTDDYIKKNVIFSESARLYGRQTYFGRKILYKTKSGAKLVFSLPFLHDSHDDIRTANLSQFPRLEDALTLLDQIVSSRYPNSVTPLVSAHAEAAIPLNLGKKVLQDLARKTIDGASTP